MRLSFRSFHQLNEGSSDYRIAHLEDLDVEKFISAVETLRDHQAVQKLDGANLRAGLDDHGELYASREQKGGKRFYRQADFPKTSAFDGFRAAFAVLKKVEDVIKGVLVPGEAMNLEVIYGAQPNTVIYGKDNLNYLAILEMVQGDDPSIDPDQSKVKKLVKELGGGIVHVETSASDTTDGITIARAPRITDWKITRSDEVPNDALDHLNFGENLGQLKKFLSRPNERARKMGKDLTNFEVLKDRDRDLTDERKSLDERIRAEYKLPIKQTLLKIVKKLKPSLRGELPRGDTYSGIEGIIFTDPKTREKFKVVDRDVFTRINQFNYEVRKSVASRTLSTDTDKTKESHGGIVGEARLRSVKLFNLENADLPNNAKRVLEKFRGRDRAETVKRLVQSIHQLNFQAVRRKIQSIYVSSLNELDEDLDAFKKNASSYNLKLDNGTSVTYTPEIRRRTLMVFAEARQTLMEMLARVREAKSLGNLIEVFFSRQLDELFGAPSEDE